jgi:glycosyltransferase involved in cell wall biosynthesis
MRMSETELSSRKIRLFSVVIPCYNEAEVLPLLFERLTPVLNSLGVEYEVILVDDGSRDATARLMRDLSQKDPHYQAVILSRNYGHQIALSAGLDHSKGDAVAVLDSDLQDPPELLTAMLAKWKEGFDVVYGQRISRLGETWSKKMSAAIFYWLIRRLAGVDIPGNVGDFRLMDQKVVQALRRMPERFRFIRGLVVWAGFKQVALPFERPPRAKGETKYPWKAMLSFAFDAIFSFSVIPLRIAMGIGLLVMLGSVALIGYTLYLRLVTHSTTPGFAALYIVQLTMGGLILITLGIIGEYLGRIYVEVKGRPLYFVESVYSAKGTP